jgi:hypothetical protein
VASPKRRPSGRPERTARRERTTGLPRARRSERTARSERRGWWSDRTQRIALLGVPGLILFVLAGFLAWSWYDDTFVRPNHVILRVEDQEADLGYFADRLPAFQGANPTSDTAPQGLFRKIEEEELTVYYAAELGITITGDELNAHIADGLGVPYSTESGSPFDTAYRNLLRTNDLGDGTYRRLAFAELADERIRERLAAEIGTTGETITYRFFSVVDEATARDAYDRISAGASFDGVADDVSPIVPTDGGTAASPTPTEAEAPSETETAEAAGTPDGSATSGATATATASPTAAPGTGDESGEGTEGDGEDGEDEPIDPRMQGPVILEQLPDALFEAMEDAQPGELVGPIQLQNQWFVILVTERDPEGELEQNQVDLLVDARFLEILDELRGRVQIERSFDQDDIEWALDNG